MAAYDRLPRDLRAWLAEAALPWSAASVLRLWQKALQETGCPTAARARLARAEAKTLAREAVKVWGPRYPGRTDVDPRKGPEQTCAVSCALGVPTGTASGSSHPG